MALNKCLILVGLVTQCIAAALQAWSVLYPEETKKLGQQGPVFDEDEFLSSRDKWVHIGALLIFIVGALLQIVGLLVGR